MPVISLKAVPTDDLQCPFVSDAGCQVYEDRPSSCRTYPLARAITRSRETGEVTEHFALIREDHCWGCDQTRKQTVKEWIEDQQLPEFNRFNDMLMDVISMKNQYHPAPLDFREQHMFHMALYDLDGFRQHLQEHGLPETLALEEAAQAEMLADDVKLLSFAHEWIKWALFDKVSRP